MHISKVIVSTLLLYTTAFCTEKGSSSSSTTTLAHATDNSANENITSHHKQPQQNESSIGDDEEELNPYQISLDAITHEWAQICRVGCEPGTFPGDTYYLTQYLIPHLINIQYKPTCSARNIHLKYFRDIVECSGRHDLCAEQLDKVTVKCRDKALRKVTTDLKHVGEGGMNCEREEEWQGEFYESVLEGMRWYRTKVCAIGEEGRAGEMRDCRLMVSSVFVALSHAEYQS